MKKTFTSLALSAAALIVFAVPGFCAQPQHQPQQPHHPAPGIHANHQLNQNNKVVVHQPPKPVQHQTIKNDKKNKLTHQKNKQHVNYKTANNYKHHHGHKPAPKYNANVKKHPGYYHATNNKKTVNNKYNYRYI